jgi:uncharacterized protein YktA (UPF0223 family)
MLDVIYDDLEGNKNTIRFLESENVRRIEKFANNILEAVRFGNGSVRRSPGCIMSIIRQHELSSRFSTYQIEQTADNLSRGCASDMDAHQLEIAEAFLENKKSGANQGRNYKLIGSRDYINDLASNVFGDFARSSDFQRGESYDTMIRQQIVQMITGLKANIHAELDRGQKQMSANQKRVVFDAVNELEKAYGKRIGADIRELLEGYHTIGTGIEGLGPSNDVGLVEALFKSITLELEAGIGYGISFRTGTTVTVEGTVVKYTITIDHNGVKNSFSSGIGLSKELISQIEAAVSAEYEWSGEFIYTAGINQREKTVGRTNKKLGTDVEVSIGYSAYKYVGGGIRIVFNISEYRRLRGR